MSESEVAKSSQTLTVDLRLLAVYQSLGNDVLQILCSIGSRGINSTDVGIPVIPRAQVTCSCEFRISWGN